MENVVRNIHCVQFKIAFCEQGISRLNNYVKHINWGSRKCFLLWQSKMKREDREFRCEWIHFFWKFVNTSSRRFDWLVITMLRRRSLPLVKVNLLARQSAQASKVSTIGPNSMISQPGWLAFFDLQLCSVRCGDELGLEFNWKGALDPVL